MPEANPDDTNSNVLAVPLKRESALRRRILVFSLSDRQARQARELCSARRDNDKGSVEKDVGFNLKGVSPIRFKEMNELEEELGKVIRTYYGLAPAS